MQSIKHTSSLPLKRNSKGCKLNTKKCSNVIKYCLKRAKVIIFQWQTPTKDFRQFYDILSFFFYVLLGINWEQHIAFL